LTEGELVLPRQDRPAAPRGKRLDIQGLRALAVSLVVIYHLFPTRLPGGYIGVDIFFVISGFLITGHLLREAETRGRIHITEFWAKRIRRLLPASLLVLLTTVILTMTVMPANTRTQTFGDIGFAASYILNWRLATNSVDYLNADFPPTLVQHYWSLSIEEQFYLAWPILIATLLKHPPRRFILTILILTLLASLTFSICETARSQPSAYFLTTTRAWEFALGGLIAMIPASRMNAPARGILSITALTTITACAFLFGPTTAFPGAIALLPVTATAILIWCGDHPHHNWPLASQRLTHNRAIQFLGDTSYSVYLWHWPLVLSTSALFPEITEGLRAVIVIPITIVLGWLTLKLVEDPIRKAPGLLKRRSVTFGLMFITIAAIVALVVSQITAIQRDVEQRQTQIESLLNKADATAQSDEKLCVGAYAILNNCANPHTYNPELIDATLAQEDKPWHWINEQVDAGRCTQTKVGTLPERACDFPGEGTQIMLVGDSHVEQLMGPMQRIADAEGWGLRLESRSACPLFILPSEGQNEDTARCAQWGEQLISTIVADPTIDVVMISVRVSDIDPVIDASPGLNRLRDAGKQVIVVRDLPAFGITGADGVPLTGPNCLLAQGTVDDACSWPATDSLDWLSEAAVSLGIDVIDTHKIVCPDGVCHTIIGGVVVYTDNNHLTGKFALSLEGWLSKELDGLVS
jgi:peptidoglycan/LPS O-acetylase OafA/YrhL